MKIVDILVQHCAEVLIDISTDRAAGGENDLELGAREVYDDTCLNFVVNLVEKR